MTVKFEIPGEPVAQGRPRVSTINGSPRLYDAPKSASYKGVVALFAKHAMRGRDPIDSAVRMEITVLKTVPRSWSKKKTAAALSGEVKPTTRPDVDNYTKAILDGINGIVFIDDCQVTHLTVSKQYAQQPSVVVTVNLDEEISMEAAYGTKGRSEHHGSE